MSSNGIFGLLGNIFGFSNQEQKPQIIHEIAPSPETNVLKKKKRTPSLLGSTILTRGASLGGATAQTKLG